MLPREGFRVACFVTVRLGVVDLQGPDTDRTPPGDAELKSRLPDSSMVTRARVEDNERRQPDRSSCHSVQAVQCVKIGDTYDDENKRPLMMLPALPTADLNAIHRLGTEKALQRVYPWKNERKSAINLVESEMQGSLRHPTLQSWETHKDSYVT